jgi:hypothetical protein
MFGNSPALKRFVALQTGCGIIAAGCVELVFHSGNQMNVSFSSKTPGRVDRASDKGRKVAADVRRWIFRGIPPLPAPPPHVGGYFVTGRARLRKGQGLVLDRLWNRALSSVA